MDYRGRTVEGTAKVNDCMSQADCFEALVEDRAERVSTEKRKVTLTHTGTNGSSLNKNRNMSEANVRV